MFLSYETITDPQQSLHRLTITDRWLLCMGPMNSLDNLVVDCLQRRYRILEALPFLKVVAISLQIGEYLSPRMLGKHDFKKAEKSCCCDIC